MLGKNRNVRFRVRGVVFRSSFSVVLVLGMRWKVQRSKRG